MGYKYASNRDFDKLLYYVTVLIVLPIFNKIIIYYYYYRFSFNILLFNAELL